MYFNICATHRKFSEITEKVYAILHHLSFPQFQKYFLACLQKLFMAPQQNKVSADGPEKVSAHGPENICEITVR